MTTTTLHRRAPAALSPPCIAAAPARRARSAGFSMIEVLVTIVLFSFGLLGLAQLQLRASQVSMGAEDSTRAALLAGELASAMWGQGSVTVAAADRTAWLVRVADTTAGGLPNGLGDVAVTGKVARITVTWRPPHEDASRNYRYVTEVLIP